MIFLEGDICSVNQSFLSFDISELHFCAYHLSQFEVDWGYHRYYDTLSSEECAVTCSLYAFFLLDDDSEKPEVVSQPIKGDTYVFEKGKE